MAHLSYSPHHSVAPFDASSRPDCFDADPAQDTGRRRRRSTTCQSWPVRRDADDHLVEMPAIAWCRTASPQSPRNRRCEFDHPTANALVGQVEPTLGKRFLNVAVAQGRPQVEPNCLLKYDGRETMPTIGDYCHTRSLGRTRSDPIGGFPDNVLTSIKLGAYPSIRVPHLRLTCPHQQRLRANNRAPRIPIKPCDNETGNAELHGRLCSALFQHARCRPLHVQPSTPTDPRPTLRVFRGDAVAQSQASGAAA